MAGRAPKEGVRRRTPSVGRAQLFGEAENALLASLLPEVEQLVGEHFHLSSFGPVRRCYEVVTLENANDHDRAESALAKLSRYDRSERPIAEGERVQRFYRICLQDDNLLARAGDSPDQTLRALLTYVLAHELIHVVRFESYQVHFSLDGAGRHREEEAVHALTRRVLAALRDDEVDAVCATLEPPDVDVVE